MLHFARRELPAISRASVYATLSDLVALGLLGAFGRSEPVRFETNTAHHHHFWCRYCRRAYDVALPSVATEDFVDDSFTVEGLQVMLEGMCPACSAFADGMHRGAADLRQQSRMQPPAHALVMDSAVGSLFAAASDHGVRRIAFEDHADAARIHAAAGHANDVLTELERQLADHFTGARVALDVPIDWRAVPPGSVHVLRAVHRVPYGRTASYAGLREGTDRPDMSDAVGTVVGGNIIPLLIPCHRVVRGAAELIDYSGGMERKQRLLALEGVSY